jgi:hypothetical protein
MGIRINKNALTVMSGTPGANYVYLLGHARTLRLETAYSKTRPHRLKRIEIKNLIFAADEPLACYKITTLPFPIQLPSLVRQLTRLPTFTMPLQSIMIPEYQAVINQPCKVMLQSSELVVHSRDFSQAHGFRPGIIKRQTKTKNLERLRVMRQPRIEVLN